MAIIKNIKQIKQNKLFEGVPDNTVKSVFKPDRFLEISEGEVIYQTGDEADCIFLILKGETKIKYPSHHYISNKFNNEFFGEKELFDKTRRISSAVANTDSLLYQLASEKLRTLLDSNDSVDKNINKYGEVVLPEIEQTAQSNINLSNPDKPISFKTSKSDSETSTIKSQDPAFKPGSMDKTVEQPIVESEKLEITDDDIVIQDKDETGMSDNEIFDAVIQENIKIDFDETSKTISEQHTKDFNDVLNALLAANNSLTSYDTIHSFLVVLKKLISCDAGEIYLVNENTGEIGKYINEEGSIRLKYHKISDSLTGTCVLQKKTLNFDKPSEDSRFVAEIDRPWGNQFKKILYTPLISADDTLVGVLLLAREGGDYSNTEISKVEMISKHISSAIKRGLKFEQLLQQEKHKSDSGVYEFIEVNIAIPVDIISSYSSILKQELPSARKKGITILLQMQVKFLRSVIRSALDYNKHDFNVNLEKENLSTFLRGASELLSEYCDARGIKLYRNTGTSAVASFDAGYLYMALYQLIRNACDVSGEKSNIFVSLETDGAHANILVSNEGKGIDQPEDISFTPGYDENKGRYRLGLSIAKRIIELHSGQINFTSDKNESTIFTLSLPLINEEEVPSLLDYFEPAFELDESEKDFTQYLEDGNADLSENSEN